MRGIALRNGLAFRLRPLPKAEWLLRLRGAWPQIVLVLAGLAAVSGCTPPQVHAQNALPSTIQPGNAPVKPGMFQAFRDEGKTTYALNQDATFCAANTNSAEERAQRMLDQGDIVIDPSNTYYYPYSKLPGAVPPRNSPRYTDTSRPVLNPSPDGVAQNSPSHDDSRGNAGSQGNKAACDNARRLVAHSAACHQDCDENAARSYFKLCHQLCDDGVKVMKDFIRSECR